MAVPSSRTHWHLFQQRAEAAGLNVRMVLARDGVEQSLGSAPRSRPAGSLTGAALPPSNFRPSDLHPGYQRVVLLGSSGKTFWARFRAHQRRQPSSSPNPLDAFTERRVERLVKPLRGADPEAIAAYPFQHSRRLVPFLALLQGTTLLKTTPFGVIVHPEHGPWFAWRAAIFTALPFPVSTLPRQPVCTPCPAPCVTACPAGAVSKEGFNWRACVDFRLSGPTCRLTCLARLACPVGEKYRYGKEQMTYHYGASLNMIRKESGPA